MRQRNALLKLSNISATFSKLFKLLWLSGREYFHQNFAIRIIVEASWKLVKQNKIIDIALKNIISKKQRSTDNLQNSYCQIFREIHRELSVMDFWVSKLHKIWTPLHVFSCELCKIFQCSFSTELLQLAADIIFWWSGGKGVTMP